MVVTALLQGGGSDGADVNVDDGDGMMKGNGHARDGEARPDRRDELFFAVYHRHSPTEQVAVSGIEGYRTKESAGGAGRRRQAV